MTFSRPQRLVLRSLPGSLLKRRGVTATVTQTSTDRDPTYLALVRQCPCLKCGLDPAGTAAHLRLNSALHGKRQAMARKPNDAWSSPLCSSCHINDPDAQHKVGEAIFWDRLGINPFLLCQKLYAQRGDMVAMRAVVFTAIAERGLAISSPGETAP